jgi:hypothetical protein
VTTIFMYAFEGGFIKKNGDLVFVSLYCVLSPLLLSLGLQ